MNDQNGFDNNGVYHYNYTAQPSDPWERDRQTPPTPPQPPKKRGGAGKIVALVLCCALVGGPHRRKGEAGRRPHPHGPV